MVAVGLGYMSVIVGICTSYTVYCIHISESFPFHIDVVIFVPEFKVTNVFR